MEDYLIWNLVATKMTWGNSLLLNIWMNLNLEAINSKLKRKNMDQVLPLQLQIRHKNIGKTNMQM